MAIVLFVGFEKVIDIENIVILPFWSQLADGVLVSNQVSLFVETNTW